MAVTGHKLSLSKSIRVGDMDVDTASAGTIFANSVFVACCLIAEQ